MTPSINTNKNNLTDNPFFNRPQEVLQEEILMDLDIDCDPEENNCRVLNYMCFKTAIWCFDKKMMIKKASWGYGGVEQFFRYEDVVDELRRVRELAISTPSPKLEERIEYYNFEHISMDKYGY